jgi:hypothetical protein
MCANSPEEHKFELVVVDAISGEIVVSRTYDDKEVNIDGQVPHPVIDRTQFLRRAGFIESPVRILGAGQISCCDNLSLARIGSSEQGPFGPPQ